MSLHVIRCPIDYFVLIIIHLYHDFPLSGEVKHHHKVLVYFPFCSYKRSILTILLTNFSKDAIDNLAVDVRYLQIVHVPKYRKLLTIDRLVNHTFILWVDGKAPSFEIVRGILPE